MTLARLGSLWQNAELTRDRDNSLSSSKPSNWPPMAGAYPDTVDRREIPNLQLLISRLPSIEAQAPCGLDLGTLIRLRMKKIFKEAKICLDK